MKPEEIAVIMLATQGGRLSPALYGIPVDRVEEFLQHPGTEGSIRGSKWFLCYTTLADYVSDVKDKYFYYRKDSGKHDQILNDMLIYKYDVEELASIIGRTLKEKK